MSTKLQSFNRSRVGAFTQSELGARNAAGKRILIWNKDGAFIGDPKRARRVAELSGMDVTIDAAIAEGDTPEWTHSLDDYTLIAYDLPDSRFYTKPVWYEKIFAKKWRGRLFWRINPLNSPARIDATLLATTTHIPSPVRMSTPLANSSGFNAVTFSRPLTVGVNPFPLGLNPGRVKGGYRLAGIPRALLHPVAPLFLPWTEDVPFVAESSNGRFSIVLMNGPWALTETTKNPDGSKSITQAARFFRNLYEVDI